MFGVRGPIFIIILLGVRSVLGSGKYFRDVRSQFDQQLWVKNIFRIKDLPEPLRQRFQNFGLVQTLASTNSKFWICPNPCVKDFRILDLPF